VQSGRSLLTFHMNISEHLPDYMVSHPIRQYPPCEPFLMVMNIKIALFQHVMPYSLVYIVACLLKATTVKPAETALARQRLCKHACC
jgi:hypothetical protein